MNILLPALCATLTALAVGTPFVEASLGRPPSVGATILAALAILSIGLCVIEWLNSRDRKVNLSELLRVFEEARGMGLMDKVLAANAAGTCLVAGNSAYAETALELQTYLEYEGVVDVPELMAELGAGTGLSAVALEQLQAIQNSRRSAPSGEKLHLQATG